MKEVSKDAESKNVKDCTIIWGLDHLEATTDHLRKLKSVLEMYFDSMGYPKLHNQKY